MTPQKRNERRDEFSSEVAGSAQAWLGVTADTLLNFGMAADEALRAWESVPLEHGDGLADDSLSARVFVADEIRLD